LEVAWEVEWEEDMEVAWEEGMVEEIEVNMAVECLAV
jgi:hypothetical protein